MRSFVRHGLVIGTCLGAMLAMAGCEQKKATEYVTGVSTQVTVPRDLKTVRIQVSTGGFVQFCNTYKVLEGGRVILPRSLGNYPKSSDNNSGSVTFSIVGLTQDYQTGDINNPVWADCSSAATVGSNSVRILRRSTQPYIPEHIKFLPMSLKYSCFDIDCKEEGKTCKGGVCVDATISEDDAKKLPDYYDGMGEGQEASCFSTQLCMGASIPAAPINEDTCLFAVAESADAPVLPKESNPFRPVCSASNDPVCTGRPCTDGQCELLPAGSPPWTGVNVEVSYDGGHTHEILDYDPVEGFTIPDKAHPQIFQLAPNLCKLLKDFDAKGDPTTGHRITSVRASGTCAAKLPTQSICYPDQLKLMTGSDDGKPPTDVAADSCKAQLLKPVKSALVLVVDETTGHSKFFGHDTDDLGKLLQDPALVKTDVALLYANSASACTARTFDLKPALETSKAIADGFTNHPPLTDAGDPFFEQPLADAFTKLRALGPEYARRAVAVIGDRKFDDSTCGDAATSLDLVKKARTDGIFTFAARVVDQGDPNASGNMALAGAPNLVGGNVPYEYDVPKDAAKKKAVLQAIINNLATCLYDVAADSTTGYGAPPDTATLSYADPLTAVEKKIEHLPAGATCATGSGWTLDTSDPSHPRVQVCGQACTDYQTVLGNASSFTILYHQAALPVPLYSNTAECYKPKP